MQRRDFLKFAFGVAAGAAALTTAAQAAPLSPRPIGDPTRAPDTHSEIRPAVTSSEEAEQLKPEQVHWHRHWRRRHWGWRRRHWGWRRRHWGWRRHHWHRHHWRHW
jgi:hypothetical protein